MATDETTETNETVAPEVADAEPAAVEPAALAGERRGPNWFITLLWYIFIGSWLSGLWSAVAWVLSLTLVGLPLGNGLLNRLPQVAALQSPLWPDDAERPPQAFWLWRLLYFIFIGWWLSFVWLAAAWVLSLTIIGLPLALAMWKHAPGITSLARY